MPIIIDNNLFLKRALKAHGNIYKYLTEYEGANKKITIKCLKCSSIFKQRPADHWSGRGCQICANKKIGYDKRLSNSEFIKKAEERHGNKYKYLTVCEKSSDVVRIKCNECDTIFKQKAINHYRGQGCPKCSIKDRSQKRKMSNDEFLIRANFKHNEKFEYIDVYNYSDIHMTIRCKQCDKIFTQTPNNHLDGHGCPNCKRQIAGQSQIMDNQVFLNRAFKIHGKKYSYLQDYTRSRVKLLIKCNECQNTFIQKPNNHLQGQGCPKCAKHGFQPTKEATLYYIYDSKEDLYKIGITNRTLEDRFSKSFLDERGIEILQEINYSSGEDALKAEQEILEAFNNYRCTNNSWPEDKGGKTEFFNKDILELHK